MMVSLASPWVYGTNDVQKMQGHNLRIDNGTARSTASPCAQGIVARDMITACSYAVHLICGLTTVDDGAHPCSNRDHTIFQSALDLLEGQEASTSQLNWPTARNPQPQQANGRTVHSLTHHHLLSPTPAEDPPHRTPHDMSTAHPTTCPPRASCRHAPPHAISLPLPPAFLIIRRISPSVFRPHVPLLVPRHGLGVVPVESD